MSKLKISVELFYNFVRVEEDDKEIFNRDQPVYRLFCLKHIEETLRTEMLTFVDYKKWDDPYENFIHKYYEHLNENRFKHWRTYGLCWSKKQESDAMWRIYSKGKQSVKVKITPNSFIEMYEDHMHEFTGRASINYLSFFEPVRYRKEEVVVNYMKRYKTTFRSCPDPQSRTYAFILPLITKRDIFDYEGEVRSIYCTGLNSEEEPYEDLDKGIIKFKIDPNNLFEEIILNPRLNMEEAENITTTLKTLGYKNRIEKSLIYEPPDLC